MILLHFYRMHEDIATFGKTSENQKRLMIADVISRIRFKNNGIEEESIPFIEQLIALRRISLLLMDHFNKLEVEIHGRTWEKMVIVLNNDAENQLSERKKRRKSQRGGESGFKFSVSGDDDNRDITVTVPIDFLDEELINELEIHLEDFYVDDDDDFFNFI